MKYLQQLKDFLESDHEEFSVVTMPDFFLDRLISPAQNVNAFYGNLESIVRKKGGSMDNITQAELRGGNAINTASALAALGAKVTPVVCTDKLGLELIKFYLKPLKVDLSHIKVFNKPSITTAMEFEAEGGKVNVMLRDVGALADFGTQHLTGDDFGVIEDADYVCVFNWAGTRRFGTELAKIVFHRAKTKGIGKTYYDTADPTPNEREIPKLVKSVLQGSDIDILSVNENEAVCFASQLDEEMREQKDLRLDELAKESAKVLASHLSARVDLHTTNFSATFTKKSETIVPAFQVPVLRATGAGDAWNAGNTLGDAHKLSDDCRLALANAVAAYYISNPYGMHPSRRQLVKFCNHVKTTHRKSAGQVF
jgi:sugar/nucleoside kinase (ribokinase family)